MRGRKVKQLRRLAAEVLREVAAARPVSPRRVQAVVADRLGDKERPAARAERDANAARTEVRLDRADRRRRGRQEARAKVAGGQRDYYSEGYDAAAAGRGAAGPPEDVQGVEARWVWNNGRQDFEAEQEPRGEGEA